MASPTADLLDGFSLRDRDFDDWLTGERKRLREHAVQLFLRLMQRAAAIGVEPAIRWALRIQPSIRCTSRRIEG